MISFSPFTDMFLIQLREIFLECQLCRSELGRQGQSVQRRKGNGMWEGLGRGQGCLSLSHPPAGSPNVLAHFRVLDLSGKKHSRRFWDCGPKGERNRGKEQGSPSPGKSQVTWEKRLGSSAGSSVFTNAISWLVLTRQVTQVWDSPEMTQLH